MLEASIQKNDKQARLLIGVFSFVVFAAVVLLSKFKLNLNLGFDVHIFARINAIINSIIAVLLIAALVAVKNKKYILHRKLMFASLILSILFLVSYIAHHLLAGETKFGGEGVIRIVYLLILFNHISWQLLFCLLSYLLLTGP
jgi:putative membrane protein